VDALRLELEIRLLLLMALHERDVLKPHPFLKRFRPLIG
jgi:hypothetical protein